MAYDSNQMPAWLRRFIGGAAVPESIRSEAGRAQQNESPDDRRQKLPDLNDDPRLPDGRSQKNAIAKDQHDRAVRDAEELAAIAQDLYDSLNRPDASDRPGDAAQRTEQIEKLARRIRGRLRS